MTDISAPRLTVNGQFLKDLSFESPGAPLSLMQMAERPKIDISVDLRGNPLKDDAYELLLQVTSRATVEDKPLFVVEVSYGGVFTLKGLTREQAQPVLMIEGAALLFPFVRRLVADTTRDGGFPPLLLEPVNFAALYEARKNHAEAQEQKAAAH